MNADIIYYNFDGKKIDWVDLFGSKKGHYGFQSRLENELERLPFQIDTASTLKDESAAEKLRIRRNRLENRLKRMVGYISFSAGQIFILYPHNSEIKYLKYIPNEEIDQSSTNYSQNHIERNQGIDAGTRKDDNADYLDSPMSNYGKILVGNFGNEEKIKQKLGAKDTMGNVIQLFKGIESIISEIEVKIINANNARAYIWKNELEKLRDDYVKKLRTHLGKMSLMKRAEAIVPAVISSERE